MATMQTHGAVMIDKGSPRSSPLPLPPDLAAVALVDAATAAGTGDMSLSWWHGEVAARRAPQPVIRLPRCTRWRLADVRDFWIERARQCENEPDAGARLTERASNASAAARRSRSSSRVA